MNEQIGWKMYIDGKLHEYLVYDVAYSPAIMQLIELIYPISPRSSYVFVREGAPDLELH